MNIQTIQNVSDCVPLYLPHSLYLKPVAKINVSVQLPIASAITGKTISNWDVMDKIRKLIAPDVFSVLRVSKSTLEFIRLEAEIDEKLKIRSLLNRLDGASIKLSGISESVRLRASEMKDDFPTRHDWDSFFRDARNMDEMKAGERPDTIYFSNLPITWFCPRHQENMDNAKPSENIFKRIFEKFGEVRCVDIPICDPYRPQMKTQMTGLKAFAFDNSTFFEGYVQFNEYLGFVKTMDEFRGMKLVRKDGEKNMAVNVVVEFDKSKHMSESTIKRRKVVRDRLIVKEQAKEEEERKKREVEELKKKREQEKKDEEKRKELEKQKEREEKRKEKQLKKIQLKERVEFDQKIREEEKKLLAAQRKLESIRLLEALFERVKSKSEVNLAKHVKTEEGKKPVKTTKKEQATPISSKDLRNKIISKYKNAHENDFQKRAEKLKKVKEGKGILTQLLAGDAKEGRSPSIDTISSNDSIFDEKNSTSKKAKKKKKKKSRSSSTSSSSSSSSAKSAKKIPEQNQLVQPVFPQQGFPTMYNPETGEWVGMGMGVYPYAAPFFPGAIRPNFYQTGFNPNYRGRGRFPRGRGRGFYRGRGNGSYNYDDDYRYKNSGYGYEEEDNYRHNRRSRSRSRSYSRSRSRRGSRRSRSKSRSRSSRSRSHSRHRSSRSKKLASTLRKSKSPSSSSGWSRSRSRNRSKRRSWSRRTKSHSRSQSRSRSRSKKRDKKENKSNDEGNTPKKISKSKSKEKTKSPKERERSESGKRSRSADSSKFMSPKHKEKSATPDWSK